MTLLPSLLVSDTNIWIDLQNGGLIAEAFDLPYRIVIPDLAQQELVSPSWEILIDSGLTSMELRPELILELGRLREIHINLSIVDLAAFLLSKDQQAVLLSGDRRLVALAREYHVPVHGVLWLLDQMVVHRIIPFEKATTSLREMLAQGARLPADECEKRFSLWRSE